MLLTRCPTCNTTFRITADLLVTAGGQARCGRCNEVFDAVAGLREESRASALELGLEPDDSLAQTDEFFVGDVSFAAALESDAEDEAVEVTVASDGEDDQEGPLELGPEAELLPEAELVQEETAEEPSEHADVPAPQTSPADEDTISPEEVHAVLEPDTEPTPEQDLEESIKLLTLGDEALEPRSNRWWRAGAACAALLLVGQIVNHARGELATHATVGPLLQKAYAALGITLVPSWDIAQYQIVDWVAAAEPKAQGQGSLHIAARIHNRGPQAQPYPKVRLDLTDRWDNKVGSRVFEPTEYLAKPPSTPLMRAGSTVEAALSVLDPGPDAYGFELDVCIDATSETLVCATDQVFR